MSGFYRSRNAVVAGVCGGIAESLDMQPWGVRAVALLLMLFTFPIGPLVYFALAMMMKKAL